MGLFELGVRVTGRRLSGDLDGSCKFGIEGPELQTKLATLKARLHAFGV